MTGRRRRLDKYDKSVLLAVEALRTPRPKQTATPKPVVKTPDRRPTVGDRVRLPTGRNGLRWHGRASEARIVVTYPRYALVEFAAGYREAWHYTDLEVIE